jgi:hypothetical protein
MPDLLWNDAVEAERIFRRANDLKSGAFIALNMLTAAELCVLGGMNCSLVDQEVWSWWTGKSEADRFTLLKRAIWLMKETGKLELPLDGTELQPGNDLLLHLKAKPGIILAGKLNPSFIALLRRGEGGPSDVRMYGISDERAGLRGVLQEWNTNVRTGIFGTSFGYTLFNREGAVAWLAALAVKPPEQEGLLHRRPPWVIDVHQPGGRGAHGKIEVAAKDGKLLVTSRRPGGGAVKETIDEAGLGRLIGEMIPA